MTYTELKRVCEIMEQHGIGGESLGGAAHDIIFLAPLDAHFSDAELLELKLLGCHVDEENDCISAFV